MPIRLLVLAILVVTASTQAVFLLGAAFVQMGPEFGYGPRGLGLLTGLFFLTSAATSAPFGRVVARIGWRSAMRLNAVASGLLLLSIGLAARNLATLVALLVASAAVYGIANPAANQALADLGDPRRRALLFGLKHAGIPSSTLLAGLAVPAVVVTAGWRTAYVAASLVAVVVLVLVPRTLPAPHPSEALPAGRALTVRELLAMAAGSAFATWGPIALSTFLVAAAVEQGFSPSAAGLLLFVGSGTSIAARVVAGEATDRLGGRGFAGMATMAGVGAVVFLTLPPASGAAFAVLIVVAFATGWGWPGLMTFAVVNANAGTVAASSSITQAGVFVGAGVGPLLLGAIVGSFGFDAAWLVASGGLAASAAGVATVGVRTRHQPDPTARVHHVD